MFFRHGHLSQLKRRVLGVPTRSDLSGKCGFTDHARRIAIHRFHTACEILPLRFRLF